jgi:hypothetical protein
VRLRAQLLRLSNRASNMEEIFTYTGRSQASIARELDRWRRRALATAVRHVSVRCSLPSTSTRGYSPECVEGAFCELRLFVAKGGG